MNDPAPPPQVPESRLHERLVKAASLMALVGLGVTVAHLLVPSPALFALFMTVGQGAFGLAVVLYVAMVLTDLRRRKVL